MNSSNPSSTSVETSAVACAKARKEVGQFVEKDCQMRQQQSARVLRGKKAEPIFDSQSEPQEHD